MAKNKEYKMIFTIEILNDNLSIEEILETTDYIDITVDNREIRIKNPNIYDSDNNKIV